MSKVEERAKERYWLEPNNIETQEKYAAYVEGYHQAEKDLALTAEDIKTIDKLLNQCVDCSNPYQEVLKRFKDFKERKEK